MVKVGYTVQIYTGINSSSISTTDTTSTKYYDGDIYETTDDYLVFKITRTDGGNVSVSDELLKVIYVDNECICSQNDEMLNRIAALSAHYITAFQQNYDEMPLVLHASDIHSDYIRLKRAIQLGVKMNVAANVFTGDIVAYNAKDGYDAFNTIFSQAEKNTINILVAGDHDNRNGYGAEEFADKFMKPCATKWSYSNNNKSYYYKDNTEKKLRFIVIDEVEGAPEYYYNVRHLQQAQAQFLVDSLASTPENYGIIICIHKPQGTAFKPDDNKFYFPHGNGDWSDGAFESRVRPIVHIVDLFNQRGAEQYIYNQSNVGGTYSWIDTTVTLDIDFSNVPSSVEFIAYMNGDCHWDYVSYVNSAVTKQLQLGVCSASAFYDSTQYNEVGKMTTGSSQDSFNIYRIDRTMGEKKIYIYRIGAQYMYDMSKVDYDVVVYK